MLLLFGFYEKWKQLTYFFNIWKKALWRKIHSRITLSQYYKCLVYVLPFSVKFPVCLVFRKFIYMFPLHTQIQTQVHTQTHTLTFICYGNGRRLPANIYYFLVEFIHSVNTCSKKRGSLVDINKRWRFKWKPGFNQQHQFNLEPKK